MNRPNAAWSFKWTRRPLPFLIWTSAGGHVEQIIESIPANAQNVAASLSPSPTDFLPLDDQAWAVLHNSATAQTTLVTNGNFFLQTALNLLNTERTGAQVELTLTSPKIQLPA
ncbi:MAG: hypothetical protein U0401_06035 [Anaerolineae bacterium]